MKHRDESLRGWREALRRNFRRLPAFRVCGNCGSGSLFAPYDPKLMGCSMWCYTCGAKDAETQPPSAAASAGKREGPLGKQIAELRRALEEAGVDVDRLLEEGGLRRREE